MSSGKSHRKILVWHQGALGDLILSLPAIYAIRKHGRGASLHLVCRGDMADLIVGNNLAETVTSNETGMFGGLFGKSDHHPGDLKEFLEEFDSAFVFMRNRNNLFLGNMGRHIARCYHIRTFPPPDLAFSVPRYQLQQLAESGVDGVGEFPVLCAGRGLSAPGGPPVIAIHPGSGGKKKCWPLSRYLSLMDLLLREERTSLAIILGPAEEDGVYETIRRFISEKGISAEIVRNQPVSRIASVLKNAVLFIGNDSGITHLAAVLGTPSVAIFGPTDHQVWRPLGDNVSIVRSGVPCSPCGEEVRRKCSRIECLGTLPVEAVVEQVREMRRTGQGAFRPASRDSAYCIP